MVSELDKKRWKGTIGIEQRSKNILNRKKRGGGYPVIDATEFVFVAGGAGPAASVESAAKLADLTTPYIHYGQNSAPGKHRFETGVGPSTFRITR